MNNIVTPFYLQAESTEHFDRLAFSRMRFGVRADVNAFARRLATSLEIRGFDDNTIIAAVQHDSLTPAGLLLAHETVEIINEARDLPIDFVTILQTGIAPLDYTQLSEEERRQYFGQIHYGLGDNHINGRSVILIDDIRVTGGHEEAARAFLGSRSDHLTFGYAVVLQGSASPRIEQDLTMAAVRSPKDLLPLMMSRSFTVTSKLCNYILSCTNVGDLIWLLRSLPNALFEEVYRSVFHSIYWVDSKVYVNKNVIEKEFQSRVF